MNLDWVKMSVSSGGTGTLTLAAVSGYPDVTDYWGSSGSRYVRYCVNDDANGLRETGVGSLALSTLVLTRTRIDTTHSSGTIDNSSPAALNFGTSNVFVTMEPVASGFIPTMPFAVNASTPSTDLGVASFHGRAGGSSQFTPVERYAPYLWPCSAEVVQAAIYVASGTAATNVKIALYEMGSDGFAGALLYDFGVWSLASSGAVLLTSSPLPFFLPAGWYYVGWITDSGTPSIKGLISNLNTPAGISQGDNITYFNRTSGSSYATGLPNPATALASCSVNTNATGLGFYLKPRNT